MLHIHNFQHHLLVMACLVAATKADGWDDFANNLATDLAPILALFGEQATKQFLSESTTRLDNFIFAMAPLGILTAVVSAIRVCGGPSLRAFIGRAQEGGGIAEAELCSSTSRDVCELFHNGAIVRVFGRPKILEIVHDREASIVPDEERKTVPECGIYPFQEYIKTESARDAGWKEIEEPTWSVASLLRKRRRATSKSHVEDQQQTTNNKTVFAPNPNLSFNIGIRERPRWVVRMAAVAGFLAQASVVVFGFLVTYTWGWTKEEVPPSHWAFPLMVLGTLLLNSGMFYCAFLVETSTSERLFQRHPGKQKNEPNFHVIQPGNQTIGDQTFDAFSFTDAYDNRRLSKYTTSWKNHDEAKLGVWLATGSSMFGFVLQFVGLRTMHSAVSVVQLGAILFMTTVRAGLRTQRLGKNQNLLRNRPDEVEGHELDWLALEMAKDGPGNRIDGRRYWSVIANQPTPSFPLVKHDFETYPRCGSSSMSAEKHQAERAFLYRSRLAELTSHSSRNKSKASIAWDESVVHVRQQAWQLKKAIESSAKILFAHSKFESEWKHEKTINWVINVAETSVLNKEVTSTIRLALNKADSDRQSDVWKINQNYLEAVVGLWAWSIISDPKTERKENELQVSTAGEVPMSRIMAFGVSQEETERAKTDLDLWIEDFPSITTTVNWTTSPDLKKRGPNSIWKREVSETVHRLRLEVSGCPAELRLYGWQIPSNHSPAELYALTTTINGSITEMCAQDIYQSFLHTISDELTSVGGESKLSTGNKGYFFTNDVVSRLAECFKESGLGSIRDAYSIIVPVLRAKLPLPSDVLPAAYSQAESCRREGNFQKAETILKWAWKTSSSMNNGHYKDARAACMLELGELYRYAIFSGDVIQHNFGSRGIFWMQEEVKQMPQESSVAEVVTRYVALAEWTRKDSETQCSADEVLAAATQNDRIRCLCLISRVTTLSSAKDRTVLSWAAQQGWSEIVKAALEIGSVLDSEDASRRTPLSYAAEHGHVDVVEILLRSGAVPVLEDAAHRTPLSYAVAGGHLPVMELLLEDRRVTIFTQDKDNNSLLHWAATNGRKDAVDWLIKSEANNQLNQINEHGLTPLIVALLNNHTSTADFLFNHGANIGGGKIKDIEALEWAISHGEWTCVSWLLRLPDNEGKAVAIKVTFDSGRSLDISLGREAKTYIFDGNTERKITMETVETTLRVFANSRRGLMKKRPVVEMRLREQNSSDTKMIAFQRQKLFKIIGLLLSFVEGDVLTMGVVQAALDQETHGEEAMKLLLQEPGHDFMVTEEVIKTAAGTISVEVMELLLNQRGHEFTVTEEVVKAAAGNRSVEVMELLLNRRGHEFTVTGEVIEAAAANRHNCRTIMELLLDQRGHEFTVTEEVVKAAAKAGSPTVMELLLKQRGHEFRVTNEIVEAVAVGHSWPTMELILSQRGHEFTVTEEVVKKAAGNSRSEIIKLLLDRRGHEFTVTGEVIKAAATNRYDSRAIIELLLDQRGHEFTVTEDVVKKAAGNSRSEVMELLLDRRGHEFTVTNEIVEAAAAYEAYAALGIFSILLDQRSQEITVTDGIVNAAARNKWHGEEIVKLLFDGRAIVQLTQEGKEMMANEFGQLGTELLLNWKGQDATTKGDYPADREQEVV